MIRLRLLDCPISVKNVNVKAVLFDLDGTLIDPGVGITNSVMHALNCFGFQVGKREDYYKFIGPPLLDSFKKYCSVSDADAAILVQLYREYFSSKGIFENEVYCGICELLEELQGRGAVLCLATSKPEEFSLQILKQFGLNRYFSFAACSTMDEKRTNKGDVIAYALELLGRAKGDQEVIMVGDREFDIIGAHQNGLKAIGVSYGYGCRDELINCGADYIVDSVSQLSEILCLLG